MKIRDLSNFDLGRLVGWPAEEPRKPFFARLFRRRRRERPYVAPTSLEGYRGAEELPARFLRWGGPVYLRATPWRRDLLAVMEQVRAVVRVNGPLPDGLLHAAREERRFNQGFRLAMLPVYLLFGLVAVTGIAAAMELVSARFFVGFLFPAVVVEWYWTDGALRRSRRERAFLVLAHRMRQGVSLSDAMAGMPRFFPAFFVSLVRAGETTGNLEDGLAELGDNTLRAMTLARGVGQKFAYVLFVAFFQFAIMLLFTAKILPVFVEIIQDMGGQLPWATRALLSVVETFDRWADRGNEAPFLVLGVAVLALLTGLLLVLRRRRRSVFGRWFSTLCLAVPGLRGLLIKHNLGVAAMMLEKLLRAGVPLPEALDAAGAADLHPWYRARLERLRDAVNQGESLSDACDAPDARGHLPRSFRGFVGLGEQSGMLPDALHRLAAFYRRDTELRVRILSDSVLPVLVLGLGGLTLFYELATMGCLVGMISGFLETL